MTVYITETDIHAAKDRLRPLLSAQFRREFFGRARLDRLQRIVGGTIHTEFLLDLIVRQEGPQLLAARARRVGPRTTSIRRELLESLPEERLHALYRELRRVEPPAKREKIESDLTDFKWHRGSGSALRFARALGLPDSFAGVAERGRRDASYEIEPIGALPPLKPFQRGILRELRGVLDRRRRAMVSSFTGTGKTRIGMQFVTETLLGEEEGAGVLWVAQKGELLEQACDSIEQLWPWVAQSSGQPLHVFRYWEGQHFDDPLPARPVLVVATAQQLLARISARDPFVEAVLARVRLLVIDEAHHALARGHRVLIEAHERARAGRPSCVLGLSATPGRSNLFDPQESARLAELFGHTLIVPLVPAHRSALAWFQSQGYLAYLRHQVIDAPSQVKQTLGKLGRSLVEEDHAGYRDYTSETLSVIGEDSTRNRRILETLTRLHLEGRLSLVFCCTIAQAEMLAQSLLVQGITAGVIHHEIDRRDRHHTIRRFRNGELRTLVNVEVLTTGFDAPKVDTIVMCRPTLSRVLYEQMIGRGMRGPEMGGTPWCEIVDFTTNFGRFEEPQAWEAFWDEWRAPAPTQVAAQPWPGWEVIAAEPEGEGAGVN